MTSIIAAMQDSLLLIESSKTGWKSRESLKGCHPESVTFVIGIQIVCIAAPSVMDYGKVMMPDIIGIELQKTPYPVMASLQFQLAAWNRKIECTLERSP